MRYGIKRLWRCPLIHLLSFSFLSFFFFYCAARGRNLKTAAPEMCDTLRKHKSHLVFCCDSISFKTQRHIPPIFTWCCYLVLKSNLGAFERKGGEKKILVPAASIHVAKQQERSYRSQYTATRKAVIGCRWLKPERWQDSLCDSPAELHTTSSWVLFSLSFNQCLWCADPRAKLSQVHADMHRHTHTTVLRVQLLCRSSQSLTSSLKRREKDSQVVGLAVAFLHRSYK